MQNSTRWLPTFGPSRWTWTIGRLTSGHETTSTIAIYYSPWSRYSFYHPTEGRRLSWCCTTLWDIPFNILNLLLQWNGDITSRHASTGNTVLHVVCAGGHTDLVQFLLAAYDDQRTQLMHMYNDLPVNLLNFDGHTSLMLAADRGNHYAFTQDFHTRGLSNKVGLICYLYKYLSFIQKSSQNPFISAGPRHIIRKSSPLNLVLVPRIMALYKFTYLLTYFYFFFIFSLTPESQREDLG